MKFFYCKLEDLSWIPRDHVKILAYSCNLSVQALETGGFLGLDSLGFSGKLA